MIKVWTNGCFDLLHPGHIDCFEQARGFGDYLIVGLNSDRSVHELKGDGRPIMNQDQRQYILLSIRLIDEVIIFDGEPELYETIKMVKPDYIVKGADWKGKPIVGEDLAEVKFINFRFRTSTSEIIDRCQREM